jgi:hypothetical protein
MDAVPSPRHLGAFIGLMAVAVAGVVIVTLALPGTTSGAAARDAAASVSFLAAGAAIWVGGRSWPGARPIAIAFGLLGAISALSALAPDQVGGPHLGDVLLLGLLVPFGIAARDEFRVHFEPTDRRELSADVVLLTLAIGAISYLWLRPHDASPAAIATAATFALFGGAIIAMFGALTLCVPTTGHVLRFVGVVALAAATLGFGEAWASGSTQAAPLWIWWTFAIVPPALGVVFVAIPHDDRAIDALASSGLARPALTSITIVASAAALSIVAIFDDAHGIAGVEATLILLALAIGIASRILTNQRATAEAFSRAEDALARQQTALRETDAALERVRETNESLRRSEEHLRLIFDAAVDGFV